VRGVVGAPNVPTVTGTEIAEYAFALLNVFLPGEALPSADGAFALETLNDWLSEQSQQALMCPAVSRNRFDMTANKGSPTNPYTIGSGADLNITKPANQNSIVGANLILTATSPEVRVPLGIYTASAYDSNAIPALTNTQPTGLYYNPFTASASNEYGQVFLWPVPDNATNDLELFIQLALLQFADLTTTYYVPNGVPRMLKYNLADGLQVAYGKTLSPVAQRTAISSLGTFRRANTRLVDIPSDAYQFTGGRRTLYNIQTGAGG